MTISDRIQGDTRDAMKQRDRARVGALRMLGAALKNAEIEAGRPLTEQEEQTILSAGDVIHLKSNCAYGLLNESTQICVLLIIRCKSV